MQKLRRIIVLAILLGVTAGAQGADPELKLTLKDHRFSPTELVVPAGQKLKLIVENQDATPEEFESYSLNREKVVSPGGRIVIYVGPLQPGRYEFFGDFNASTARGWLVVQP